MSFQSMHNVLKNQNGIKRLPNLVKLFDKIQTYFHKKRHLPSFFETKLPYDFNFVYEMTEAQMFAFDKEMSLFANDSTMKEIEEVEKEGGKITAVLYGCRIRSKYSIPCRHMLRKMYSSCEQEVASTNNNSSLIDMLDNDAAVMKIFQDRLNCSSYYKMIVSRHADVDEVIQQAKTWDGVLEDSLFVY
jgi:hypothetical protein